MKSKILLTGWIKTLVCSYIISFIIGIGFAKIEIPALDWPHTIMRVAWAALSLNVILFIMSMLSLYLTLPKYYHNTLMRYFLYFGGIIMYAIALLFIHLSNTSKMFYLVVCVIYLIVSIFFYKRTIKALAA